MFKLLELELSDHPVLGNLRLNFVNKEEIESGPYTTLIIGPNGTGKSQIFKTIIEIFRSIDDYKRKKLNSKSPELNSDPFTYAFKFNLIFYKDGYYYACKSKKGITKLLTGKKKKSLFGFFKNDIPIDIYDFELPSKLLASSIVINDKFPFQKSDFFDPKSFYEYLGIRTTSNAVFTGNLNNYILDTLARVDNYEKGKLQKLFSVLKLKPFVKLSFTGSLNKEVFKIDINADSFASQFKAYFIKRQKGPSSTVRKKEVKYSYILSNPENLNIIQFYLMKELRSKKEKLFFEREYEVNFEDLQFNSNLKNDYLALKLLLDLEIIKFNRFDIFKEGIYEFSEASSGEYHMLSTFFKIVSKIQNNAIVLIDEPEISLHPNLQMEYIHILKDIFSTFKSCHFILATHSHFLVSDLEDINSELISLKRGINNKIEALTLHYSTYGWSAEDILYNIFEVRTVRNFYFEFEIRQLLNLLSTKSEDKKLLNQHIKNLEKHLKNENDPLMLILDKAKKYSNSI